MNLRVPDTLTIENSEKFILSIRLYPGGLSFAGCIPSEKETFFYGDVALDRTKPYTKAIKETFFEYPFFSYTYRNIYIVSANRQYTLVPEMVFLEKQKNDLMSFVFSSPEEKILHNLQKELDIEAVFAIHPEVYDFFSHTVAHPRFIHAISPMLSFCRKQNLSCFPKQLYVAMHEDIMDAVCFDKGALVFANSFTYNDAGDIVYYILYIWKQAGMDQMKDELFLYADPVMFQELKETLQNYLLKVDRLEIDMLNDKPEVPLDVKALFTCGL